MSRDETFNRALMVARWLVLGLVFFGLVGVVLACVYLGASPV